MSGGEHHPVEGRRLAGEGAERFLLLNREWLRNGDQRTSFNEWLATAETTVPEGQAEGKSSEHGSWQLDGENVFRRYEFPGVPSPGITTSLRIELHAYRALNGSILASLRFELRPYLYLLPDRMPIGQAGELVTPPFAVALWAAAPGAGTEQSPIYQGGLFEVYACSVEEDAETVMLGTDRTFAVMHWVQAISTGTELTFSICDEHAEPSVKLRLQLPNDQEFAQLYNELQSNL